jgi:hypothetical protein
MHPHICHIVCRGSEAPQPEAQKGLQCPWQLGASCDHILFSPTSSEHLTQAACYLEGPRQPGCEVNLFSCVSPAGDCKQLTKEASALSPLERLQKKDNNKVTIA